MIQKTLEPIPHTEDRTSVASPSSHETTTIAVIGLGYVGLPLAIRAATREFPVIGFDIDTRKIESIRSGDVAYITPEEQAELARTKILTATMSESKLKEADVFIICVPTPVNGYEPDLAPLEGASHIVSKALRRGNLVIVESTVNPGACEEVVLPILEKSGLKVERDFYLAHCPERINPGDSKWAVGSIPRVIGGAGPASLEKAQALYEQLVDAQILPLNTLKEAEAVKMVENAFRDINIAFVNELAMAFDRAGIDLVNVIRGASTKPFAFMPHFPGAGVGGHCIPVDPYYLIRYGEKNGFMHRFLITARSINNRMPHYTVSMLSKALRRKRKQLSRSTVALLGVAYKRDVPDMRESPAEAIRDILEKRGAVVRIYDPHVPEHSTVDSLEEALQDADAALIATDHSEFRTLTPFHFMRSGVGIVIDGRNCLRKEDFLESGVHYSGIGRATL
ncbi:nucleotide sugar dehydrogenase [bacterium]|nr:nucleotide sugar dehydrogenase [bacterium]